MSPPAPPRCSEPVTREVYSRPLVTANGGVPRGSHHPRRLRREGVSLTPRQVSVRAGRGPQYGGLVPSRIAEGARELACSHGRCDRGQQPPSVDVEWCSFRRLRGGAPFRADLEALPPWPKPTAIQLLQVAKVASARCRPRRELVEKSGLLPTRFFGLPAGANLTHLALLRHHLAVAARRRTRRRRLELSGCWVTPTTLGARRASPHLIVTRIWGARKRRKEVHGPSVTGEAGRTADGCAHCSPVSVLPASRSTRFVVPFHARNRRVPGSSLSTMGQ